MRDALVEAATARTRPIFLTAAAGVLSSIVIASDPVWSGLAWALVFGMTASAVLSVIAIPLLYERVTLKAAGRQAERPPIVGHSAMKSLVTFPELDDFVMESTVLLEGETVQLDAEVFRGEGDAIDGVARLFGPFVVEHAGDDVFEHDRRLAGLSAADAPIGRGASAGVAGGGICVSAPFRRLPRNLQALRVGSADVALQACSSDDQSA